MRFKRMWAIFHARNREFFRDRAAFGWNFLFPFLIILGFGVIFKGDYQSQFKVGLFPIFPSGSVHESIDLLPESFVAFKAISLVGFETRAQGMDKLKHHKNRLVGRDRDPTDPILGQRFIPFRGNRRKAVERGPVAA